MVPYLGRAWNRRDKPWKGKAKMLDEYITHYSPREGEDWIPWASTFRDIMPPQQWLDERLADRHIVIELRGQTMFGNNFFLPLHAFRTNKGREWDCVNGWRTQPLENKDGK